MEWQAIEPRVNAEAEFFEILNDFGNPLEIVREAISNAIDAGATEIRVHFAVEQIEGNSRSVIRFVDNGSGMCEAVLRRDFWGLGHSTSREKPEKIGEKGHGTKIFLRSERVSVVTRTNEEAWESHCDRPLSALSRKLLHEPKLRSVPMDTAPLGTSIEVVGYNDNERSKFVQAIVRDYILWFTKVGSIEKVFGIETFSNFRVHLKCLDVDDFEEIGFGHVFPEDNSDIEKLFAKHGPEAAGLYTKRYTKTRSRLANHPEITFDAVISVEGDDIKRKYNPMLRERGRSSTGTYRVFDRYGIWLCKDYIPIVRVNDWISGFGSGSNAFVLLHGFINCQSLKLTANRGTIANTDPKILEELQKEVQTWIGQIDSDLTSSGLYTLRGWQEEIRTLSQEKAEFTRRIKALKARGFSNFSERTLFEPGNESELFGLLTTLVALMPNTFEFEPLDYNTNKGIDLIVRDKRDVLSEHSLGYAELKMFLVPGFNHAFKYLKWIVCWDFGRTVTEGSRFEGIEEGDVRTLRFERDSNDQPIYYLDAPKAANKIHVIRLKELLLLQFQLKFEKRDFLGK